MADRGPDPRQVGFENAVAGLGAVSLGRWQQAAQRRPYLRARGSGRRRHPSRNVRARQDRAHAGGFPEAGSHRAALVLSEMTRRTFLPAAALAMARAAAAEPRARIENIATISRQ